MALMAGLGFAAGLHVYNNQSNLAAVAAANPEGIFSPALEDGWVVHKVVPQHVTTPTVTTAAPSKQSSPTTAATTIAPLSAPPPAASSVQGVSNPQTDVSGRYDVEISGKISLATASTSITKLGGQVLFSLPYLHVLVARLTPGQVVQLRESSVMKAEPETVVVAYGSTSAHVRVAIVDHGDHGQEVLSTYLAQCGASCPDPDPLLVDAEGPDGSFTDATVDDAIMYAISQGATIVNISSGSPDSATPLTTDDLNMLSYADANGVSLVVAAGNSPDFVDSFALASPYRDDVVEVGGLNPDTGGVADYSTTNADVFANDETPDDPNINGTSFAAPRITAEIAKEESQMGTQDPSEAIAAVENAGQTLSPASTEQTADASNDQFIYPAAAGGDDSADGAGDSVDSGGDGGGDGGGGGDGCSAAAVLSVEDSSLSNCLTQWFDTWFD
jgi:hypothetical protein